MSSRKKVNESTTTAAEVRYQNLFAQLVSLVGARKTILEYGRGSSKTTEIICERVKELMFEMAGAPIVWVADTFTNLSANIIPSFLEGLERKGFREGVHYVIEKAPPEFTDKETEELPPELRKHFWKPVNKLVSYKRTIIFYTGLNITFGSLDRPSTLAGRSYVFLIGDEGKYFKPEQLANIMKAVRGYPQYNTSPYYRGVLFTSDVADPSRIGEYDWMGKQAANMDKEAILLVIRIGLVYNEAMREAVAAKDDWMASKTQKNLNLYKAKLKVASRWRERWVLSRLRKEASTFYFRASSYINADILSEDWFADAIASGLPDTKTAVLSIKTRLDSGNRFYTALAERHFYFDGTNEREYDKVGMMQKETCMVLKHVKLDRPLSIGVDFGNMCSMCCAQLERSERRQTLRVLKFIYTLAPEYIADLGEKFRYYFAPMKNKVLYVYYDRSGNAYQKVGKSQISQLKNAIERDEFGKSTGWSVHLMSRGQGNIRQSEEYNFMQVFLSENNSRLPVLRIDAFAAKPLKLSLEGAKTKIKNGIVYKDKSSEKLEISKLPTESTNPSDALKYLLMRPDWRKIVAGVSTAVPTNLDISTI